MDDIEAKFSLLL